MFTFFLASFLFGILAGLTAFLYLLCRKAFAVRFLRGLAAYHNAKVPAILPGPQGLGLTVPSIKDELVDALVKFGCARTEAQILAVEGIAVEGQNFDKAFTAAVRLHGASRPKVSK